MKKTQELSQDRLIGYLEDMSAIEVREFTLRKAVDELQYRQNALGSKEEMAAQKEKTTASNNLNNAQTELLRRRPHSDAIFQAPPEEPKKPDNWDKLQEIQPPEHYGESDPFRGVIDTPSELILPSIFIFAGVYLALAVALLVIYLITSFEFEAISASLLPALAFVSIFITAIIAVSIRKRSIRKYNQKTEKWRAECKTYQKDIEPREAYQRDYALYQLDCKNFAAYQNALKIYQEKEAALLAIQEKRKVIKTALDQQIAALQPQISILFQQKYELYALDIIPRDYRTLDCVLMLLQIFRNSLKDKMSEAILLYEERVFRQEVIRGLDNIYQMLGNLNASMHAIEARLIEVREEVILMGNDLCNRLDRMSTQIDTTAKNQEMWMESQERWQEDMLSETRASHYAAEAVQNSNAKYEWYMEQHRQGLI